MNQKDEDNFSWKENFYKIGFLISIFIMIDFIYYLSKIIGFIFNLRLDNYNYLNPPIYFSIGEAITAIGLIFAVYQLRRGTWLIALETRKKTMIIIGVLLLLGLIFVFIASIIPLTIKGDPNNIFQAALFWEILAGIFLICSPGLLLFNIRSKDLFKENTAANLYSSLLRRITSKSSEDLNAAIDVLKYNLKDILRKIPSQYRIRRDEQLSEIEMYAHHIVGIIISDPMLAEHIIVSRADFFQLFLSSVKKYNLWSGYIDIDTVFNSLMKAAFKNKGSYLYRELEFSGTGIYKPFLNGIFFDQRVFQELRPFDNLDVDYGERVDIEKVELFISAFEIAIKGYWHNNHNSCGYSHFRQAFEKLEFMLSRIIDESDCIENKKQESDLSSKLIKIEHFLGNFFMYEYKEAVEKNKVSEQDLNVKIERKSYGIYPVSLTSYYIKSVYNFLCIINDLKEKSLIRHYAMEASRKFLLYDDASLDKMRELLLELIWEQIKENIKGFYPLVLPSYLSVIGMWQSSVSGSRKDQYNKIVDFLNKKVKPLILKNKKMANDDLIEEMLLPPEVKFNRKKGLFEWQMMRGVQGMIIRK